MVLPSVDRGQFVILTEHGNRIDIAVTYGFDATPRAANARLIAAAPDLLDFAKEFVEAWQSGMAGDSYLLRIANAVIAKATGEQV